MPEGRMDLPSGNYARHWTAVRRALVAAAVVALGLAPLAGARTAADPVRPVFGAPDYSGKTAQGFRITLLRKTSGVTVSTLVTLTCDDGSALTAPLTVKDISVASSAFLYMKSGMSVTGRFLVSPSRATGSLSLLRTSNAGSICVGRATWSAQGAFTTKGKYSSATVRG